ncbi:hypothetical protein [Mesorhizobium sp. CN2-181]|uniref:hypothetical protein n=1 Tax=Mesorhizobium yinganensis TaxID=3157707 RepID=UPI0032B7A7E7
MKAPANKKPKVSAVEIFVSAPKIDAFLQYRIPSSAQAGDASISGSNFTNDFVVKVYKTDAGGNKIAIGTVVEKSFESTKEIYFSAKMNSGDPPGKDKTIGLKFPGFEEVFSNATFETA